MAFDDAILALSKDALRFVKDGNVLGLGSGRAATAFVRALSNYVKTNRINIKAVPTSLQIKLEAEKGGIHLIEADQLEHIDVVFDGADQIDQEKYMIKGGGGALLKENILINLAKKVIIMADETKFVKKLNRSVPVEIIPFARTVVAKYIKQIGGKPKIRTLERGYPFVTENGNVILDCNFGKILKPKNLAKKIIGFPGVMEVGIFTRKPNLIFKAKSNGKFDVLT